MDDTSPAARSSRQPGQRGSLRPVLAAFGLGVAGLLVGLVLGLAGLFGLATLGVPAFEDLSILIVVGTVFQGLGLIVVAVGYLRYRDLGVEFVRLRMPDLSDVLWTFGGLLLLFVGLVAVNAIITLVGIGSAAEHELVELGMQFPEILLLLVPLSLLVIGPGEELLFRGVIQTRLVDVYGLGGGIVATSVVFAIVHLPAYATGTASEIATSIVVIFTLSLILGWIYERTDNLVVPAIVHGVYNAILFASLYAVATTEIAMP